MSILARLDNGRIAGRPKDQYATVTIPQGGSAVVIQETTPSRFKAFLIKIANGVQSGGEPYVRFRLLVNGTPRPPFDGSLNQWGDPSNPPDLDVPEELPQSSLIQVVADRIQPGDPAQTFDATARFRILLYQLD